MGNAPGWASLRGARRGSGGAVDPASWTELLPKTRLQPDTRHVVRIPDAGDVDTVRLDVFPDGGMARVRLHGALSDQGRAELRLRWSNSLPAAQAGQVLERDCGLAGGAADGVVAGRPVVDPSALPGAVRSLLTGVRGERVRRQHLRGQGAVRSRCAQHHDRRAGRGAAGHLLRGPRLGGAHARRPAVRRRGGTAHGRRPGDPGAGARRPGGRTGGAPPDRTAGGRVPHGAAWSRQEQAGMADADAEDRHHHVPLLLSPYASSTYRGS